MIWVLLDEFIIPFVADKAGLIQENDDAIIFANFRPDRAIRIATAFSNPEKTSLYQTPGKASFSLESIKTLNNIFFVSMMHL